MRGVFNPLGQVEVPALIPEGEEREEEEEEEGYRVLDDWLVDDLGQPPPKRRRQRELDEGATGSIQRSGSHQSLRQSGSGGRKRRKRASGWQQPETSVVEINSDSEDDPAPEGRTSTDTFGSGVTITSAPLQPSASVSADAPLRIKVRIEGTSYLIPCPRRTEEGKNTTIAWLAAEAAERYYSQHRVRPQLSLTTVDGALLCPSDTAAHVLQSNEEVVGRVEHWHLPPLSERYQTACRTPGVGEAMCDCFCSHLSGPVPLLPPFSLPLHRPQTLPGQWCFFLLGPLHPRSSPSSRLPPLPGPPWTTHSLLPLLLWEPAEGWRHETCCLRPSAPPSPPLPGPQLHWNHLTGVGSVSEVMHHS